MWQRFTERARRVILLAQEEAGKLNSEHVGTEHLLLGLARLDEGSGVEILQGMNVTVDKVRTELLGDITMSSEPKDGAPKLTPKAKRVLELGAEEARLMRHNYIGTEHLLLALLREKDGLAATVLRRLGLSLDNTRARVAAYLDKTQFPTQTPAPTQTPMPIEAPAQITEPVVARFHVALAVRRLLDRAAQESRERGASELETAHLLLAMCQPNSESAQILERAGVDVERLRLFLQSARPED